MLARYLHSKMSIKGPSDSPALMVLKFRGFIFSSFVFLMESFVFFLSL